MTDRLAPRPRLRRFLWRLLQFLALAVVIGWILHRVAAQVHPSAHPAGFTHGLLHGALMPMSLPNLLVGDDVPVYAPNNTGRTYKLGYTAGVNVCGLIFFGFFFWRIRRWKEDPLHHDDSVAPSDRGSPDPQRAGRP